MLPKFGTVEMNVDTPPWSPTCLLTHQANNASMEATAENFKALFDIVQGEINKPDEGHSPMHTPKRPLRRRNSDPQYRQVDGDSIKYMVKGRGWIWCLNRRRRHRASAVEATGRDTANFSKPWNHRSRPVKADRAEEDHSVPQ